MFRHTNTHARCKRTLDVPPPPLPLDQVIKNRAVERTKSNGFLCGWCIFIFFFLHIPKVTMRIINMRWLHFMSYRIHVYIFSTRRRMVLQTTKQKKKINRRICVMVLFLFLLLCCVFIFICGHTLTPQHTYTHTASYLNDCSTMSTLNK